jgi:hypothetical protein
MPGFVLRKFAPALGAFSRAGTGLRRRAAVIPQLLGALRFRTSGGDAIDDMRIFQNYADIDIHLGSKDRNRFSFRFGAREPERGAIQQPGRPKRSPVWR